jgi:hypothetical protein
MIILKTIFDRHKKKIIIVAIVFWALLFIKKATYDNAEFLVHIAEGFDDPSFGYFFVLERIYKIAETKKIEDTFAEKILKNENSHLHGQYLRICGVIGKSDSTDFLIKIFNQNYKDRTQWRNKNKWGILYEAIDSMGITGNPEYVPYLEEVLYEKGLYHPLISQFQVARSLYLITGKRYKIKSNDGSKKPLNISTDVEAARIAIEMSKHKRRDLEAMLVIDNILRAPNFKNKV